MQLTLSKRLDGIAESATLKMNALAKELASQGKKIINFTAGEPDFAVPANIQDAAVAAIRENFSKYTPVPGMIELRKAIAQKLLNENNLNYALDQIIVSSGAKQVIFNFFLAVLNPGDEVIIPSPYWVSYPEMVKIAGGTPVILETSEDQGFKIKPDQLKKSITPKTKAVILNSPSNPTGIVYSKKEMQDIASVLEGTSVWVVSDEIYEKLIYNVDFYSFASLSEDAKKRTLTVNGFSKAYAMTGWRLGYAAGPKELIAALNILQGQSTSGANSIAQKAAIKALDLTAKDLLPFQEKFKKRLKSLTEILSQCKEFSFVYPQGAFYLFVNIERCLGKSYNEKGGLKKEVTSAQEFSLYVLSQYEVATVSGEGFGSDKHIRLSFAIADEEVDLGARKLVEAARSLS